MKNTPLISVVIPVYNAEKFLSKCLEHLIHQTYQNLEIIIVDDGCTDNTADVYNHYAKLDKRIKILNQKNAGPSAALNNGLKNANGQYVHFHDHDDYVNLDYFEKMANAACQTDADILCGEVNQPDYNFPRFDAIEILISTRDKILKTRANKFRPAWRYLYKKSFLDKTGLKYDERIFGAQDLFFTQPAIVLAQTVATVPGAIYNVVDMETALGKSRKLISNRNNSTDTQNAREKLNEFLIAHNAYELMTTPESPFVIEKFKMFNMTLTRREIFQNKIRYYFLGLNVGTRRIYRK